MKYFFAKSVSGHRPDVSDLWVNYVWKQYYFTGRKKMNTKLQMDERYEQY